MRDTTASNDRLLVATRNAKKLDEIRAICAGRGLEVEGLDAWPDAPEVIEDGDTFEANAIKKAITLARYTGRLTLADDSGLEVDALAGAPGVYSARYAGEDADDAANNSKLLEALAGNPQRRGRFRCVIALAPPDGKTVDTVSGSCEGSMSDRLEGQGGFGYDPLFIPDGYTQSFAELGSEIKHRISHRGKALQLAVDRWFA